MTLAPGLRLGPYEILRRLGSGGMAEVYRARDSRLGRDVAIKILPAELSADATRRQRFEREAKTISSLSHANICVLHDVGSQDGLDYLVMECLEGETLAKRLEKGPLPLDQVLKYGSQMADALDKAHRSGVVHRDLKPGNIMLTSSGAKLLDFGLAKPVMQSASLATLTATAPAQSPVTQEGTIVGTFQYMSPEQVEGKELDALSDIFSLGAVLYEMLTGRKAFNGKTQLSVASAILEKEPEPLCRVKPLTPPMLDRAIRKCLAKNPEERWQSAGDLASELLWVAESDEKTAAFSPVSALKSRPRLLWLAVPILLSAGLFVLGYFSRSQPKAETVRSAVLPPPGSAFTIFSSVSGSYALSPNGKFLVFAAQTEKDNSSQLWLRPLDSLTSTRLEGTEDAYAPFWSPDSRWIGFFAGGKLKKIEASGGPVETLCGAPLGRGATWNQDGLILFSPNISQPIYSVSASGGIAKPISQMDVSRQEVSHRWPVFLPDGKRYIFFVRAADASVTGLYAGKLGSAQHELIASGMMNAVYAAPGYLLFARGDVLMAQAFDAARLEVKGSAAQIASGISVRPQTNFASFSVSQTGTLIYASGAVTLARSLFWYDRHGKRLGQIGSPEYSAYPELSPDGQHLALRLFTQPSGSFEVWVYDLTRGVHVRESFGALSAVAPVWAPNGTQLAYSHSAPGVTGDHMYLLTLGGTGKEEGLEKPILESLGNLPSSWSPNGDYLLFDSQDKTGKTSVWVLPFEGERKPYAFIETQFNAHLAKFSPDGHWVAYVSNDSGHDEVYVVPFPGPGPRVQVSTHGGTQPRWRRDGREMYYLSPETKMMAVGVFTDASAFHVRTPEELFTITGLGSVPGSLYDVSADGQKFFAIQDFAQTSTDPLTLVTNWDIGLKR